jgi:hypothetical protein
MPKNFDPAIEERAVRMVLEQLPEYGSISPACVLVGANLVVREGDAANLGGKAWIDAGECDNLTTAEDEETTRLKAENRRLRVAILKAATTFVAGWTQPPHALIAGFIEQMRAQAYAVDSACPVLREQGCQLAACTYRFGQTDKIAAHTLSDASMMDPVRSAAWTSDHQGRVRPASEVLYGIIEPPGPWCFRARLNFQHRNREHLPLPPSRGNADQRYVYVVVSWFPLPDFMGISSRSHEEYPCPDSTHLSPTRSVSVGLRRSRNTLRSHPASPADFLHRQEGTHQARKDDGYREYFGEFSQAPVLHFDHCPDHMRKI